MRLCRSMAWACVALEILVAPEISKMIGYNQFTRRFEVVGVTTKFPYYFADQNVSSNFALLLDISGAR